MDISGVLVDEIGMGIQGKKALEMRSSSFYQRY